MGYYTRFELHTPLDVDVIASLRSQSEYASYALESDGTVGQECKWYNHEAELLTFSMEYPETLFTLHGEGEESGDIWNLYVRNGKTQRAKASIVIPPPTI